MALAHAAPSWQRPVLFMKRRQFLFGSLASVVYLACGSESGNTPNDEVGDAGPDDAIDASGRVIDTSPPASSDQLFPQGLASGDPRPDRVLLWTRIEPSAAHVKDTDSVEITLIIARDEALTDIVARRQVTAEADADHTVRVVPIQLEPSTYYYYRFEYDGITSQVGRTKTAPLPDADVRVTMAMASCQDMIGRYWHSWKALLDENIELDFVMWLGDYIYESVNDPRFQTTNPEREIKLPNGLDTSKAQDGSRIAAGTLADYRTLYKAYRSDPLLREVHRRFPFILTWDDHEFADDCWQDHSTSFDEQDPKTKAFTSEQNTLRRNAADRAFSEFQPADILWDASKPFPDNIKIYRQLNYGKHVDIFMTDQRLYRADHVIPEGQLDAEVGKFIKNSMVGSRYFVRKSEFDKREAMVKPSLLGATQRDWLLDAVTKSTATWKVWGNEVQMYQMALKLSDLTGIPLPYTVYINADQWDGFRSERADVLSAFEKAGVQNLLVLTGDIHAFFASELHVDFDAPGEVPVGVEYVTAGISSASLGAFVDKIGTDDPNIKSVVKAFLEQANPTLLKSNPHLRYADADAYGFAIVDIMADKTEVTFHKLGDPRQAASPGILERVKFITRAGTNKVERVGA